MQNPAAIREQKEAWQMMNALGQELRWYDPLLSTHAERHAY